MLTDRYDNPVSTSSAQARDLYVTAVDKLLEGAPRITDAFEAVVAEDPNFALGHAGLARAHQATGNVAKAREIIGKARELATGITEREAGHINVFDLLANGRTAEGFAAVVDHVTVQSARCHDRADQHQYLRADRVFRPAGTRGGDAGLHQFPATALRR